MYLYIHTILRNIKHQHIYIYVYIYIFAEYMYIYMYGEHIYGDYIHANCLAVHTYGTAYLPTVRQVSCDS